MHVVSILLLVTAGAFAGLGYALLTRDDQRDPWKKWRSREVGTALITGTVFSLGLFALQIFLDERAKEEQFRVTIGVTRHLEGLDPEYSLKDMHLSHKVLDYAKLDGEDLTGAILQGASLRFADLQNADLTGAYLMGAKLTGAKLAGADLADAKLQSATLRDAEIFGVKSLAGTSVDADTCWPEDFLSNPAFQKVREHLVQMPKIVHGQTLKDPSLGYACATTPDNIVQVETPTPRGLSLAKAAQTFGVTTEKVVKALIGEGQVKPRTGAPTLLTPPCAESRKIRARLPGNWADDKKKGYSLLMVDHPDETPPRVMVLAWPDKADGLGPTLDLPQPLEPGTQVTLFGGVGNRNTEWPQFRVERRVRRC